MCAMKTRSRRNHALLKAGLVELRLGTVDRLPFADRTFDAAMAIQLPALGPDPTRAYTNWGERSKPGGRIAVAVSGFSNVRIRRERGTCALANVVA
jgi:hypothetical protein